jgi:hypothetical protein
MRADLTLAVLLVLSGGASAAPASLRASEHGIAPDTGADVRDGLQGLLTQAGASGPGSEVILDAGTYRIESQGVASGALSLSNAEGVTLRGAGPATRLVFTNPHSGGVYFHGCTRCTVRDLSIDWDPVPFTQGTVTAVAPEAGTFDLALAEGYPDLDEGVFEELRAGDGSWGLIFDPTERHLRAGASDHAFLTTWDRVEGRTWRIRLRESEAPKLARMAAGDRFVLLARVGPGGAVCFVAGRECLVENVTIHAAPGLTMSLLACDAMTIRNCGIRYPEGSDRLLASDGDGVHVQQNLRGPTIEGCTFEGMADDAVNLYSIPSVVCGAPSPSELLVRGGGAIEAGDTLQVFDSVMGALRAELHATEVTDAGDGVRRVTLDGAVESVRVGKTHTDSDTIFNLTRCGAGYVIRGNTFRDHRRHGIYAKAIDGLIEGNTIERVAGLGIVLSNEAGWPEGALPRNVDIRGNTIRGVGYGQGYGDAPNGAAIQLNTTGCGGGQGREVRDIRIEGNTVIDPPGAAVAVCGARDVLISGLEVLFAGEMRPQRSCGAVVVSNAEGVTLGGLVVEAPGAETTCCVEIREGTAPGEAGVRLLDAPVVRGANLPAVIDFRR